MPLVAAVLVLGGLAWLVSGLFGGQQYSVRVHTWLGAAQLETAQSQGIALREQLPEGTYIKLHVMPKPDGDQDFALFVGKAGSVDELKPLLEFVHSATLPSLPAGERPFAGATIQPYTEPE